MKNSSRLSSSLAGSLGIAISLALLAPACAIDAADHGDGNSSLEETRALEWLGDTHLRLGTTFLPPHMTPAGRRIEVAVQTYPPHAATRVEVYWANADFSETGATLMTLGQNDAGQYGNNSQWTAAIPAYAVVADQDLQYWVRAEDSHGNELWDSNGGGNFWVRPKQYSVGWIGGFGSYRPSDDGYAEGGLFNADNSTATGCWNHGVSISSYRSRAVRVWVPGLTDQDLDDTELAAAHAILQTEVFTDANADGWTAKAARFARREGNDFLYRFQFVQFNPGCIQELGDGTYEFKIRATTDGGDNWFWRGKDAGPSGGDNLLVQYAARCSYFNNPMDCVTDETLLSKIIANTSPGSVLRYKNVAVGSSSTFTVDLVGDDSRRVTVSNLHLGGPDADQFSLQLVNATTNEYVPADVNYDLGSGDVYRVVLTYWPTTETPSVLTHQATVLWNEAVPAGTGPGRLHPVRGVYLRGTTH